MICKECKRGKVVLHAFSFSKCEKCECDVVTSHIPSDKICENCSNTYNICKECGGEIKNNGYE